MSQARGWKRPAARLRIQGPMNRGCRAIPAPLVAHLLRHLCVQHLQPRSDVAAIDLVDLEVPEPAIARGISPLGRGMGGLRSRWPRWPHLSFRTPEKLSDSLLVWQVMNTSSSEHMIGTQVVPAARCAMAPRGAGRYRCASFRCHQEVGSQYIA